MASALPRPLLLLLLLLLLATTAWAQEEASSPISLPPASAPTASLLNQDSVADSDSALAPISQPPTSSSTASSPSADSFSDATHSPPAPPETSPVAAPSRPPAQAFPPNKHLHSSPAPAPAAADKEETDKDEAPAPAPAEEADDYKDKEKERKKNKSPAPAPAAAEMKATKGGEPAVDAEGAESHEEMNGGKKAGVVVGVFTAAAVVGLGAFVWKKRRANIRRARYAEYSARLELV